VLTFVGVAAAAARTTSSAPAKLCGGEHRWDVKTLSDPAASRVRYDTPKRHTIRYLLNRRDPHVGPHTHRDPDGRGVELTVYHLVGVRLVDARIEEDGDIHLVIRSKYRNEQMIVEFPNVRCKGARRSTHKAELAQARAEFAFLCGLDAWETRIGRAAPKRLTGRASIIGVGFFDLPHSVPQSGVARNNIELHPVLGFSAESCRLAERRESVRTTRRRPNGP
jgi:hypothetical protein